MKKIVICALVAASAAVRLPAQQQESFLKSQAYAEIQRVVSQVDVLQENQQDLVERVVKVEKSRSEVDALKADISALRAENAALRRELSELKGSIVRELTGEIKKLKPVVASQPASSYSGPMKEYVVEKGDTLSLIAEAFGTSVRQLREMNSLSGDVLRIGQKLKVPAK